MHFQGRGGGAGYKDKEGTRDEKNLRKASFTCVSDNNILNKEWVCSYVFREKHFLGLGIGGEHPLP